ncbi:Aldo/keto reductase [Xylariaceae sp. FL1272]|nr:Aldo/keto reductase [Xylariaceae sp. FL1272]
MAAIPTLKLNDGNELPLLAYGFGTSIFAAKEEDVINAVVLATKNGYYHLDNAECYLTEAGVGAGIKASGIDRSKLYVTTKVIGSIGQDIAAALDTSLAKLGLDHVDLYLVHSPFSAGSDEGERNVWAQMEAVKASGKAKSIGVSNFQVKDLENILSTAKVKPAVNQIEYNPYHQGRDVIDFCRKHGIAISAFSALAPLTGGRPGPADDVYAELAEKYRVTESDIGLRYCLDQDMAVITLSKNEERLQGFLKNALKFKLEPADIEKLSEAGKGKWYGDSGLAFLTKYYGNYQTGVEAPKA